MGKRILSVFAHTEYGNLEDSDIGIFATAFGPAAGHDMTVLLTGEAVNYAVKGQDGSGITIAGTKVQPGFLIETDLASLQQAKISVYVLREDREALGLAQADLITGVQELPRAEMGSFITNFDHVWNW